MVKVRSTAGYGKLAESGYGDCILSLPRSLVFSVVVCLFSAESLISGYVV